MHQGPAGVGTQISRNGGKPVRTTRWRFILQKPGRQASDHLIHQGGRCNEAMVRRNACKGRRGFHCIKPVHGAVDRIAARGKGAGMAQMSRRAIQQVTIQCEQHIRLSRIDNNRSRCTISQTKAPRYILTPDRIPFMPYRTGESGKDPFDRPAQRGRRDRTGQDTQPLACMGTTGAWGHGGCAHLLHGGGQIRP